MTMPHRLIDWTLVSHVHRPALAVVEVLAASTVFSSLFGLLHYLPLFLAGTASALSASWYAFCLFEAFRRRKKE